MPLPQASPQLPQHPDPLHCFQLGKPCLSLHGLTLALTPCLACLCSGQWGQWAVGLREECRAHHTPVCHLGKASLTPMLVTHTRLLAGLSVLNKHVNTEIHLATPTAPTRP